MIVIDDLLVKPFLSLLDILHTMALNEMYDIEELQDELKENRLLYEVGDISKKEYERRKKEIKDQLETAEMVRKEMKGKMEIKK